MARRLFVNSFPEFISYKRRQ